MVTRVTTTHPDIPARSDSRPDPQTNEEPVLKGHILRSVTDQ